MTTLMLVVIILSITSMENLRTLKVLAQIGPTRWVQVDHVTFKYNGFSKDNWNETLTLLYNATIDNYSPALQLTSPGFTNMHQGLVIYFKNIRFRGLNLKTRKGATASFSTSFAFSLSSPSIHLGGKQFVFFLMANPVNLSANGSPLYHKDFTLKNRKEPFHGFAIEYDNFEDKGLHITNSCILETNYDNISSLVRINSYVFGVSSRVEKLIYSWIDYHDYSKELEIRVSNKENNFHQPMVKISIDLRPPYMDLVYVGFSSQSQVTFAKILIHNRSFNTYLETSAATPNESIAPSPALAPETSPVLQYLYFNDRTAYLAKILGTIIGLLLLIMLLCSILVGFSQFGFACIANPEDLIELEFSTLGEFGKFEEEVEIKVHTSTKKVGDMPKSGPMRRLLENIKEATKGSDLHEPHEEVSISKRQSVWRRASDSHGSPEDEAVRVATKTETKIDKHESSVTSIAGMVFGLIRPSRSTQKPSKASNDLSTIHEKEQIANLIQKATHVEEEVEATRYQYKELSEATNDFGSRNKLGGTKTHETYRGILSKDSTPIIVKVMNIELRIKSKVVRAEMSILSQLQHRHLVKLLGWCKNQGKLYIVYELTPGKSLHKVAFVNDGVLISYPWEKRFKTIKYIASALQYLHEGWEYPLIHKNLKLNNVMIESEQNNCKLGDYGLSFLIDTNQIEPPQESTQLFEHITYGYFAPEYIESKIGTRYTDVYSFGILCLEIVCRRPLEDRTKDHEEQMLVEWLLHLADENKLVEAIEDNTLQESELKQVVMVLGLSLMCVDLLPEGRPTMKQIVKCLFGETPFPPTPISKVVHTTLSTPTDVSISTLEEVVSHNGYDSTIALKENILFENQNQWINDDFFVGDEAKSFKKSNLTNNTWVDIEDNFIFMGDDIRSSLPSCQANNTWVDIDDIDNPVTSYTSPPILLSQANNSWVDIHDIDFSPLTKSFQMQTNTLWVDIENISLNKFLQHNASQEEARNMCSLDQIEWVDTLEVFIPSTIPKAKPLVDLMIGKPRKPILHASPPIPFKVPHEIHLEKKFSGTISLPDGKILPPPIWPLPIPKAQPATKPPKQIYFSDLAQPPFLSQSKTKAPTKGTHVELVSPSSPTNLSTFTNGSHSNILPSSHFSAHGSSSATSLPSFLPPYYGHKKPSLPSSGIHHRGNSPHHESQSSFFGSSPMVESTDLKDHSKKIKPENCLKNKQNPICLSSPKNKCDLASQLDLFPPIWPLPIPKANLVGNKPRVIDTQMKNLVKKSKHDQ